MERGDEDFNSINKTRNTSYVMTITSTGKAGKHKDNHIFIWVAWDSKLNALGQFQISPFDIILVFKYEQTVSPTVC